MKDDDIMKICEGIKRYGCGKVKEIEYVSVDYIFINSFHFPVCEFIINNDKIVLEITNYHQKAPHCCLIH